jgi:hypothetical protein
MTISFQAFRLFEGVAGASPEGGSPAIGCG